MTESNQSEAGEFPQFSKLPQEIRLLIWNAALPESRVVDIRQRKLKITIGEWEQKSGRSWPIFPGEMDAGEEVTEVGGAGAISRNGVEEVPEEAGGAPYYLSRRFQRRVMRGRINDALEAPNFVSDMYREAKFLGLYSQCPPPEILPVCREAFDVASRSYPRAFSGPGSFGQTWFNGDFDTLYLRFDKYWVYSLGGPILDINDGFPVLDTENMRKVSKLAILWDLEPNPNLGPGVRPLVEDWTAPVLKLFGGVEELTLVLRHYQSDREQDSSNVSFIDPIDVDKALEIYNKIISDPKSEVGLDVPSLDMGIGELDMELLEEYRQNFGEGNPRWTMPKFVQRITVTEGVKKKLDDARIRAEVALKERAQREPLIP
jgi:hypothetical protein